ncbi:carbohydrate kinase family protein [Curtobacterium caseinilyticum]|uniref:PfkB family carbohydrate kinase n=1 Tax=Curtobacterium caseinilyticum TaxID=3055137 RepID=A0ABT7TPZ9_9MICO|nr:PfkB family carbohydrate kinase [Curtobacterium caseinilyticum]MDM7890909.1 PfkB family carbohydrate kinase [Curtobacterium caseinilyticum]
MSPPPEPVPAAPAHREPRPVRQDAGRRRGVGKRFLVVGDVLDGVLVQTTAATTGVHDPAAVIRHRAVGAAGNTATWLGWLGADVDVVTRVGVDDVHRHERTLTDAGVRAHVRYDPCVVTGALVSVRSAEGRTTMSDPAASGTLSADDLTDDLVERADVVHLTGAAMLGGGGADRVAGLVARAGSGGARVSLDPSSVAVVRDLGVEAWARVLTGVDLLLPNVAEALALSGTDRVTEAVRRLTEVVPLVVVTTGAEGAVVGRPGRPPLRVAATATTVVDTIGVGDAFAAGFLRAWATDPVRVGAAAREGTRVASRALGFVGGRPPV